jgi:hypothetical protein
MNIPAGKFITVYACTDNSNCFYDSEFIYWYWYVLLLPAAGNLEFISSIEKNNFRALAVWWLSFFCFFYSICKLFRLHVKILDFLCFIGDDWSYIYNPALSVEIRILVSSRNFSIHRRFNMWRNFIQRFDGGDDQKRRPGSFLQRGVLLPTQYLESTWMTTCIWIRDMKAKNN